MKIKRIAHRGFSSEAPENTQASFAMAVEGDFYGVECDIWKSKDGYTRDAAMYVENIPFTETRKYVQNVLLYDVIYKKLLTGVEDPLLKKHELAYHY